MTFFQVFSSLMRDAVFFAPFLDARVESSLVGRGVVIADRLKGWAWA